MKEEECEGLEVAFIVLEGIERLHEIDLSLVSELSTVNKSARRDNVGLASVEKRDILGAPGDVEERYDGQDQSRQALCDCVSVSLPSSLCRVERAGRDLPIMKRNLHPLMATGAWTMPYARAEAKQLARAENPINTP